MNKTIRLNKIQKYAIHWLHSIGKDSVDIAKEIKVKQEIVDKYINKNIQAQPDADESQYSKKNKKECVARFGKSEKPNSKTLNMMVTETAGKNQNSVCIMTKEASSLSDKQ